MQTEPVFPGVRATTTVPTPVLVSPICPDDRYVSIDNTLINAVVVLERSGAVVAAGGAVRGDWPHLTSITDPATLDAELARIRREYNTTRLHASIGYVTPDDEHHGRGPGIRRARAAGMRRARARRIAQNRKAKT